ncbi:DNA polymerase III subunit delta [Anaerovorax odorimutans]|uniref:DNA polymerase III subunit delta n=1 Tax=Anaerovorax odorimutans TaxID=109327 RepID=UPI00041D0FE3|nr:DNA polymerase III subunit delta [Anaerovorax odorimutans]
MAYKNDAMKEHAYKIINKELKEGGIKNLLFFYGRELYLINWAVESILKQVVDLSYKDLDFCKLDGKIVTIGDIKNNCETISLMSKKRVVLLNEFLLLEDGKSKYFNEKDEKELCEYLKHLPESCILIIVGSDKAPDKRKKLYKSISENGNVYDFCQLEEKQLKLFIEKKFKQAGKIAKPSIIKEFIILSGYYDKDSDYTLYNLDNDIKKIIAHSEEPEIFLTDINEIISGNINTNVFALIDALSKNRKDEAFYLLHNQLSFGASHYRLLALICTQFELILAVKEMKGNGMSLDKIKGTLGIHEFRIKKAAMFAERYSIKHLKQILQKVYDVDKNIKTGLLGSSLALEMFIAEI